MHNNNSQNKTVSASLLSSANRQRAWLITALLVLFQMINFADKAVLALVAEPVMAELGLTATQFGFIGSAFFFLFAISGIAVGFLAEKVQTRWLLLIMGASWALLQFPMLFVRWGVNHLIDYSDCTRCSRRSCFFHIFDACPRLV